MRKIITILLIFFLFSLIFAPASDTFTNAATKSHALNIARNAKGCSLQNPLIKIERAAAYYGEDENTIKMLSNELELFILQTRFLPKRIVNYASKKTLIAGYVSLLEFDGEKSDFVKYKLDSAVIGENTNWQTKIMDISNKNYRKYLLAQIQNVFDSGAQGVFLDTVDDVDDYPRLKNGTISFINFLHEKYPEKFIIVNRGFTILDKIVNDIQGILFEDFGTYYSFKDKCYKIFGKDDIDWENKIAEKLELYQSKGKIRVIASGYANSPFSILTLYSENMAKKYNFAFYCSNLEITEIWFKFFYPFPPIGGALAE